MFTVNKLRRACKNIGRASRGDKRDLAARLNLSEAALVAAACFESIDLADWSECMIVCIN